MASLDWEPLGVRRLGLIGVAVSASISIFAITLFGLFSGRIIYRYWRQSPNERVQHETRGSRFLCSTWGLLLLNLLLGDLVQAIGFALSYEWIREDALPLSQTFMCTTQAVMIQLGDFASAFGALIIGVHIFLILVVSYEPPLRKILLTIGFGWGFNGLIAVVGPRFIATQDSPFYALAGGWCWIADDYQGYRLYFHYLFVFMVSGINFILYSVIYLSIYRRKLASRKYVTSVTGPDSTAVAKVLLLYPIIYTITIAPLAIYRIASIAGHHWAIRVQLGAGVIFTLSGAFDVALYATTRRLVGVEDVMSIFRAFKRVSVGTSSSISTDGGHGQKTSQGGISLNLMKATLNQEHRVNTLSKTPQLGGEITRQDSISFEDYRIDGKV